MPHAEPRIPRCIARSLAASFTARLLGSALLPGREVELVVPGHDGLEPTEGLWCKGSPCPLDQSCLAQDCLGQMSAGKEGEEGGLGPLQELIFLLRPSCSVKQPIASNQHVEQQLFKAYARSLRFDKLGVWDATNPLPPALFLCRLISLSLVWRIGEQEKGVPY